MARSNDLKDIQRAQRYMENRYPNYYWTIGPDDKKRGSAPTV